MVWERIDDAIWLVEGEIVDFYGFPYNTRSVIVRLAGGDLWVWSPITLSDTLKSQVDALGRVAHLVSPNSIHHLFLGEWSDAYPDATMWGPRETVRKRTDLSFAPTLEDKVPAAWGADIDMVRFSGSFFMDELVFFHRPSATAIFADLSENFSDAFLKEHWQWWARPIAKLWKICEPWGYAPLEWRLSWWNRAPAKRALQTVLAWQPEKVVMAHGVWQRADGVRYIERAFGWLKK